MTVRFRRRANNSAEAMTKQGDPIPHTIDYQGEPIVEIVYMWMENPDMVAIGIQTEQKCEVDGTSGGFGGPGVMFSVRESEKDGTHIRFPQYDGWDVWGASAGKYTMQVCLVRSDR